MRHMRRSRRPLATALGLEDKGAHSTSLAVKRGSSEGYPLLGVFQSPQKKEEISSDDLVAAATLERSSRALLVGERTGKEGWSHISQHRSFRPAFTESALGNKVTERWVAILGALASSARARRIRQVDWCAGVPNAHIFGRGHTGKLVKVIDEM